MKRKVLYVLAAVVLVSSTALAAVSVSSVTALWQEVNAKIEELRSETLTETQQETLRTIQGDFMRIGRSGIDQEKLEAFKATLSESQKTAFDELMPQMPAGGPSDGAMPNGAPPERPEVAGTPPTPPSGEMPQGTPPARPEGDGTGRPTIASGEMNGSPQGGGRRPAMTEEERAEMEKEREAMEAKREAFKATLSEAQKTAYDEIFRATPEREPQEPQANGSEQGNREAPPQMEAPDLSELTSEELSEMETQLKGLLEKLNVIK